MDWRIATHNPPNGLQIPARWLYLHYYEALNILFRIENALRIIVYVTLKNEHREKWTTIALTSDDAGEGSIASVAKKRRSQAGAYAYLGYPTTSPLLFLTTGELIRLITSEAHWPLFKRWYRGSKNVVEIKFEEIISVRNALAHFRPIRVDDVETIKQSSKHVLEAAEASLTELIRCESVVPTNTDEEWYGAFKALGTEHSVLQFNQSNDESWVRIQLRYAGPIVGSTMIGSDFVWVSLLNLDAPAILKHHPLLANLVTYVSEDLPFGRVDRTATVVQRPEKTVSFTFGRTALVTNYETVKAELEQVLGQIEEETDLITRDNLARGKLVRTVGASANFRQDEQTAWISSIALQSGVREDDPPEWWGHIQVYAADFISATHTYPWMPTDVANAQY